ncbi:MAG: HAD-IB family phosphatase [Gammaproteobacteria bacterium]|nr:HAD-IB family phosphatase [Gammaproteobacteria bacterium]
MRLAIFDLDGTITRHDTLAPYVLGFLLRHPWRIPRALGVLPALLGFALGLCGRGPLKSALMRSALGGVHRSQLDAWSEQFVTRLLAQGTFAAARARIAEHAQAGDRLVLMSASPDLYVPVIGRALGFEEVICTGVRWRAERLDGRLSTPNRQGEEKVHCLRALRARLPGPASAYGNSSADLAHLVQVEHGVLVNGSARARRAAARAGLTCERWR